MSLAESVAAIAKGAWVNKRGAVQLQATWYAHATAVSVRMQAAHQSTPPRDSWNRVWIFKHKEAHLYPTPEDLQLARGYVRLITTLMGVDRKEVLYVGFAARGGVDRAGPTAGSTP